MREYLLLIPYFTILVLQISVLCFIYLIVCIGVSAMYLTDWFMKQIQ